MSLLKQKVREILNKSRFDSGTHSWIIGDGTIVFDQRYIFTYHELCDLLSNFHGWLEKDEKAICNVAKMIVDEMIKKTDRKPTADEYFKDWCKGGQEISFPELMESYAKQYALPDDKEIERIRQLGKEKYYTSSLSQNAYSKGFMDCINWIKRVTNK